MDGRYELNDGPPGNDIPASGIFEAAAPGLDAAAGVSRVEAGGKVEVNPAVALIITALRNERTAPELLPYETDLLDELISLIQNQRDYLDTKPKLSDYNAIADLYEVDMNRLRFYVSTYLRIRLAKIHKYAFHIWANDDVRERLSPGERTFHETLLDARSRHLKEVILDQLPDGLNSLDTLTSHLEGPNHHVHVLADVKEDLGEIPGVAAEIVAGQKIAILYAHAAPYLLEKKVDLF